MNKMLEKIHKTSFKIGAVFALILLFYLIFLSLTQTAMMDYNMAEYTYFINDNIFLNILFFIILSAFIYYIARLLSHFNLTIIYIVFMLIITAYMIYLIGNINLHPSWDALFVNNAAVDLKQGIYDAFLPGNYLSTYPFLTPTVLYFYFLNIIIGETNYIAFQLVNLLFLLIMYHFLIKTALLLNNKTTAIICLMFCIMFIPMQMYVMFLYSNIPSAMFTSISIYYFCKYFYSKNYNSLIPGFITLTLAVLFKGTSYVILIAFIIIFFFYQYTYLNKKHIITVLICTSLLILTPKILNYSIEQLDDDINLSTNLYTRVALVMGSSWGGRSAGWYTGYGQTLVDKFGNDESAKQEEAKRQLKENFNNLINSHQLLYFYNIKSRSMWINPDFQGFWTINANKEQNRGQGDVKKQSFLFIDYDPANDQYSLLTNSFIYGTLHNLIFFIINNLQNIIYIFSFIYIILRWKSLNYADLFIPTILLGGFLFLTLWEGKAQYSVLYYIQLFPIASTGLFETYEKSRKKIKRILSKKA